MPGNLAPGAFHNSTSTGCPAEIPDARFRQCDRDFATGVAGKGEDRLPGRDHLAGFGLAGGDHAVARRAQLRVAGLVAGDVQLRARGLGLARGRGLGGVLRIERGTADQLLLCEFRVTGAIGAARASSASAAVDLRLGGLRLQAQVAGIEFGQHLAALDLVADIDLAPHQVAADTEREWRFPRGHGSRPHRR